MHQEEAEEIWNASGRRRGDLEYIWKTQRRSGMHQEVVENIKNASGRRSGFLECIGKTQRRSGIYQEACRNDDFILLSTYLLSSAECKWSIANTCVSIPSYYTVYTVLTRSCPFSVMSLYSVGIPPSV